MLDAEFEIPPGLAKNIADHAYTVLSAEDIRELHARCPLSWVVWDKKKNKQILEAALQHDPDFRIAIAGALERDLECERPALVQLVRSNAAALTLNTDLRNAYRGWSWPPWRHGFKLKSLFRILEQQPKLRAGLLKALRFDPGKREAGNIAELLLKLRATSEWHRFAPGVIAAFDKITEACDRKTFEFAVYNDFEFRQVLARETNFPGEDSQEFSIALVEVLRGLDHENFKAAIEALSQKLFPLSCRHPVTDSDWATLQRGFQKAFTKNSALAGEVWQPEWPRPFRLVLREEVQQVSRRRHQLRNIKSYNYFPQKTSATQDTVDAYDMAVRQEMAGLAFSGGGIRSATLNLGILQALAEIDVLPHFDYLSTVSGGGYIGSWLAAWGKRDGFINIQRLLSPKTSPDPTCEQQKPLKFLRQFSNYLTPQLGAFSIDTWTMVFLYLRNVLLNLSILVTGLAAVLMLPSFLLFGLRDLDSPHYRPSAALHMNGLILAGVILMVFSVAAIAYNLNSATSPACGPETRPESTKPMQGKWVQWAIVWPVLVACILGSAWFWINARSTTFQLRDLRTNYFWLGCFALLAGASGVLSSFGGVGECFRTRRKYKSVWLSAGLIVLVGIATATAGSLLLSRYISLMLYFRDNLPLAGLWAATVFGSPLLLLSLTLATVLHVGLLGIDFPDSGREWLSRFRAYTGVYGLFWMAAFGVAIYGPHAYHELVRIGENWAVPTVSLTWVATTAASLFAGKSAKTGRTRDGASKHSPLNILVNVGPPVFAVGFLLLISIGDEHLYEYAGEKALYLWFFGFVISCVILAWRVDINEFSLHHFYKNRLVRCYLGASHVDRKPNPFTGFDDEDDVHLKDLSASSNYLGPYPIINTTLNLSAGKELAWQERKAASFVFTPMYSGYHAENNHPAFRTTSLYAYEDGIRLGTAVAISGAAANANHGYNTSPALAFLMTVFDVRLGWWIGNPRFNVSATQSSPTFGLKELVRELLGQTDDEAKFVNLSDGGHFDNMGLYELVRRRCKYIVVCDGEQDGSYTFGGLGMAIRKCRIDFGAEILLDPTRIAKNAATSFSEVHCTVGTVTYVDKSEGIILYIKASLTGDEAEDVTQYRASHPAFPHDSTGNQWFTESQFESYRKLGYHVAMKAFDPAISRKPGWNDSKALRILFQTLRETWYPINPRLMESGVNHTKTLTELLERIRSTPGLQFLGSQLFPNGNFKVEADPVSSDEFYFSLVLIQMVEDIFHDLDLEDSVRSNDPSIGGWMTLFRIWKQVPAVADTWKSESQTFQKGFQSFWNSLS